MLASAGTTALNITYPSLLSFGYSINVPNGPGATYVKSGSINAGYFKATYASGAPLPANHNSAGVKSFYSFCLDIGFTLTSPFYYSPRNFPNPNTANGNPVWRVDGIYKAAYIYNKHLQDLVAAVASKDTTDDKTVGAGIQLAIWNALYDSDLSVSTFGLSSTKGFKVTSGNSAAIKNANDYLADMGKWVASGGLAHASVSTYWDTVNKDGTPRVASQALIGPPVPEPAEAALAACALLALCLGYRRISKQKCSVALS